MKAPQARESGGHARARGAAVTLSVLFLDFDGVLNRSRDAVGPFGGKLSVSACADMLDPELVARVQTICDRRGSVVVLTTAWCDAYPTRHLAEVLATRGLMAPVIGSTWRVRLPGSTLYAPRDLAIWAWVQAVRPDSWVVLDDLEMAHPEVVARHVHVDSATGLTQADMELAMEVLVTQ